MFLQQQNTICVFFVHFCGYGQGNEKAYFTNVS